MVRGRGRGYKMGRRRIGGLETRVGCECSISKGGPNSTVEVYMSEESKEGVTVFQQGKQLQE